MISKIKNKGSSPFFPVKVKRLRNKPTKPEREGKKR